MSIDTPPITPQQYEVLHGGGAEAAEIAKQRLSRRRFLRRSMLAVYGLSATASVAGALYIQVAKTYLVHLAPGTQFLLSGSNLTDQLSSESFVKGTDGSHWVALYQRCVHLGCTYAFRADCASFKCPCHGSHYNVDGEYLDGPAPRSADRFAMSFSGT